MPPMLKSKAAKRSSSNSNTKSDFVTTPAGRVAKITGWKHGLRVLRLIISEAVIFPLWVCPDYSLGGLRS
jgi:hypothetical protein